MRAVALCGALLVALTAAMVPLHYADEVEIQGDRFVWFLAAEAVCGAVYLVACGRVLRGAAVPVWFIVAVAVGMRTAAFASPPNLSSDIYRYVWDGRVQRAGINPYLYIPADPALQTLRDAAVFENMNRAYTARTAYGPAAQVVFRAVDAVWAGVWSVKAAMVAFEAVAIAALVALLRAAGRPAAHAVLYAWCPMPVWEYAGNGHVDAAALGMLALALLAASRGRQAAAGVALGVAALFKFLPLAVAPALWARPRLRAPVACALTIAALYALYAGAGTLVLGFLGGYADEEGLSSGHGIAWLRAIEHVAVLPGWAGSAWLAAGALALVAVAVRLFVGAVRGVTAMARAAALLAGLLTVIITPHYAWYLGWLVWFGGLVPSAALLWAGASAPVLYLGALRDDTTWNLICYVPFVLLALRRGFVGAPHVRHPRLAETP